MIIEEQNIKKSFELHFRRKMEDEKIMPLFFEIFVLGTAYVVGGFFRDFLNGKNSRDIDIVVDITNSQLNDLVTKSNIDFSTNRQGGIKIRLKTLDLDIWSIENNWAFRNKLVKLNDDDKLHSIAKGCFYNFDALVINLHNYSYNLRYYKEFLKSQNLDILQLNSVYKNLNPSVEANILRAFYLRLKLNCSYTDNTAYYIKKKIGHIQDNYESVVSRLNEVKMKYPKYNELSEEIIENFVNDIKIYKLKNNQHQLDI